MAKDIVPELLEELDKDFWDRLKNSTRAMMIEDLIEKGNASYIDAHTYAEEVGRMLANTFKAKLSSKVLPDGRMYRNIGERVINRMLGQNHRLVATASAQIQAELNKRAGLGMRGIMPKIDQNRIDGFITRLAEEPLYDKIAWILDEPVVTYTLSVVEDTIEENVDFHAKSGLKPKIIRTSVGNCCEWCNNLAGTYSYPDVPDDVYRRHNNCRCTVVYDPGDIHRRKRVW